MNPGYFAETQPEKVAYVMAETGQEVTYAELEATANQGAHLFRSLGLKTGDHIAILLENHPRFYQIVWAAQRAGLYYTAISWRLQQEEVAYIVENCEAKVFITSKPRADVVASLVDDLGGLTARYMLDGTIDTFESWEDAISSQPTTMIDDPAEGASMLYSSGTTGYPKGIKKALPETPYGAAGVNLFGMLWQMDENSTYLSPAPLYHSAPLNFTMGCLRYGTKVVVMEHFHEVEALKAIERYKVTHGQWVPTMFVRMLKMPQEELRQYDLSSHKVAIHAAAPCPVPVKQQMIEWWGPVIYEYYAGSEGNGFCQLNSDEWMEHKGSVGKPLLGSVHICDEEGNELPVGEAGTIYFAPAEDADPDDMFEYHNDPDKTKDSRHPSKRGWSTLGDVGRVDEDGYLYLTDRKAFMIISGGVNIYPQEAENVLITHPRVADVAVIGVPNEDFGEEVKAVVQPVDWNEAGPDLEAELMDFCKEQLAPIKCPRSVDFDEELPRHPTGKLYKRLVRDRYWGNHDSKIV